MAAMHTSNWTVDASCLLEEVMAVVSAVTLCLWTSPLSLVYQEHRGERGDEGECRCSLSQSAQCTGGLLWLRLWLRPPSKIRLDFAGGQQQDTHSSVSSALFSRLSIRMPRVAGVTLASLSHGV